MITRKELKFNCVESTLIRVDEEHPISGFGPPIMRIASNFGGGVAGLGNICGALSAGMMALGLIHGTNGNDSKEEFEEKRNKLRDISQGLLLDFEREFGSMNCVYLLGIDRRTEEGKKLYDEKKSRGELRCDEYVEWTASKVLNILKKEQ